MRLLRGWKLFQKKFGRFTQVIQGFFNRAALADCTKLRAICDVQIAFFVQQCRERAGGHSKILYGVPSGLQHLFRDLLP